MTPLYCQCSRRNQSGKPVFILQHGDERIDRLAVGGVDADVSDLRRGHDDELPVVGRVGGDFLVAGHRRGEHRLSDR